MGSFIIASTNWTMLWTAILCLLILVSFNLESCMSAAEKLCPFSDWKRWYFFHYHFYLLLWSAGKFSIITFEEFISIALDAPRVVGIYPEIKNPVLINQHVGNKSLYVCNRSIIYKMAVESENLSSCINSYVLYFFFL